MHQNDPARVEETLGWLAKVDLDLRAAALDMEASLPLLEDVLFHSQQAVEKSLKAFLTWHDEPFRRTHDLRTLGQQCALLDPTLDQVLRGAARLSQYAWKYRYPGNVEPPSHEESLQALEIAREVSEAIRTRLPGEIE